MTTAEVSRPTVDPLASVDRAARTVTAAGGPLRFGAARTQAARELSFRLRYRAVTERGWRTPEAFPDGMERDVYDPHATIVLAWRGDVVVGTGRAVFPGPGRLLPTEEAFALLIEPQGQVVDVGRFVVAREFSTMEHRALAGIFGCLWLAARERGFSMMCSSATSPAIRLYRLMGFTMNAIAPPRLEWGELRKPVLLDMPRSATALLRRWVRLEDEPGLRSDEPG